MRAAVSAASGALFGLGLLVSGMTDTEKVRGFLALLGPGAWDPTLAFVMGGAIVPMAIAWVLTTRGTPAFATDWPAQRTGIDRELAVGGVLFGMGWGLSGLCPGPALAALAWGGTGVLIFTLSMVAGMVALPPARRLWSPA